MRRKWHLNHLLYFECYYKKCLKTAYFKGIEQFSFFVRFFLFPLIYPCFFFYLLSNQLSKRLSAFNYRQSLIFLFVSCHSISCPVICFDLGQRVQRSATLYFIIACFPVFLKTALYQHQYNLKTLSTRSNLLLNARYCILSGLE